MTPVSNDAAPAVPKRFATGSSQEGAEPSISVACASWSPPGYDRVIAGRVIALARRVENHAIGPPNPGTQIEIARYTSTVPTTAGAESP
jgi:hypothetical protein